MAALWYPLAGCLQNATERQTAYALMEVHLYKSSLVPTPATTLADLNGAEADYDGYAMETMTAFFDPIFAPGSGYMIQSPEVQFAYVDAVGHVGNTVGGAYLVDAGGALRMILALAPSEYVSFAINGDGWAFNVADVFPTGFTG